LFEQGIVQNLLGIENLIHDTLTIQDYRGYPILLDLEEFNNYPLSDEILRMKNLQFVLDFREQPKPNHKLVSPEPHFVEEERNLIENHFFYLGSRYKSEDIEEWECFQMDCEGHLVSMISHESNFQLSNESIEHLSNFQHLIFFAHTNFYVSNTTEDSTNLSLLSNLRRLSMTFENEFQNPELFKDLGLFSNLLYLDLWSHNGFENYKFDNFPFLYYISYR